MANYFEENYLSTLQSSYIQFKHSLLYSISDFFLIGLGLALKISEFTHRRKYENLLTEGLEYLIIWSR